MAGRGELHPSLLSPHGHFARCPFRTPLPSSLCAPRAGWAAGATPAPCQSQPEQRHHPATASGGLGHLQTLVMSKAHQLPPPPPPQPEHPSSHGAPALLPCAASRDVPTAHTERPSLAKQSPGGLQEPEDIPQQSWSNEVNSLSQQR